MSSSRIKPAAFQLVAQYLDEINILYLPQIWYIYILLNVSFIKSGSHNI
jgi:hypothetical protein